MSTAAIEEIEILLGELRTDWGNGPQTEQLWRYQPFYAVAHAQKLKRTQSITKEQEIAAEKEMEEVLRVNKKIQAKNKVEKEWSKKKLVKFEKEQAKEERKIEKTKASKK
jgi:hypothetical protein